MQLLFPSFKDLSLYQKWRIRISAQWWALKTKFTHNPTLRRLLYLPALPPRMDDDALMLAGELAERADGHGRPPTKDEILSAYMRIPADARADFLDFLEGGLLIGGAIRLAAGRQALSEAQSMMWGTIDYLRERSGHKFGDSHGPED